jgi:hypothetical protein
MSRIGSGSAKTRPKSQNIQYQAQKLKIGKSSQRIKNKSQLHKILKTIPVRASSENRRAYYNKCHPPKQDQFSENRSEFTETTHPKFGERSQNQQVFDLSRS